MPEVALWTADGIGTPDDTTRPELALSRRRNRLTTLFVDLEPGQARQTLGELRCSNREIEWITHLVACWHQLGPAIRETMRAPGGAADAEVRRWASVTGRTEFRDFARVAAARWMAESSDDQGAPVARAVASVFRRGMRAAYRDPIALVDLAITGGDLMSAGVPPGPRLGALLRKLLDVVLQDPTRNQRDTLLSLVREWEGLAP